MSNKNNSTYGTDALMGKSTCDENPGDDLNQQIDNYVGFYNSNFKVPVSEIFSSAAVSGPELSALCSGAEKIRIYLAKTDDSSNYGNCTFIIARADCDGRTFLDKHTLVEPYIKTSCCHNPPNGDTNSTSGDPDDN